MTRKRLCNVMSLEKLYGVHAVLAALEGQQRRICKVLLEQRRHGSAAERIMILAGRRGIPVETVTGVQLQRVLGHSQHQGVVALAVPLDYQTFASVLARLSATQEPQTILLLDGVTDVGNFAALMRSAVAFGVEVMILPRHRSVTLTATVAKRSAGAVDRLAIVQVVNVVRTIDELKNVGFWVYGADMQADTPVARITWPERLVLVLGAEGQGMRRLVRERCDGLVRVPMRSGVDSLNVAVAGAIILAYRWEWQLRVDDPQDGVPKG
jgi:23S rRNA (guanosine2251-2'-O)-methyltransferase